MITTSAYHGLEYTVAKFCNNRICYILLPEGLKDDGKKWMEEASQHYACTIITISGMDWNDARKASLELEKTLKEFRKVSVEASLPCIVSGVK